MAASLSFFCDWKILRLPREPRVSWGLSRTIGDWLDVYVHVLQVSSSKCLLQIDKHGDVSLLIKS